MLPKKARLSKKELRFPGYRSERTQFFSIKTRPAETIGSKLAVIVGKAVDKRAVRRNFLKRQAKSIFVSTKSSGAFVLTVLPKANALTKAQFRAELKKILHS